MGMIRQWLVAVMLFAGANGALAQPPDPSTVTIGTTEVRPGLWMLTGQGGNIGVSAGADGVFVIDDQYAPLAEKILAAISALSDQPLRFVVNTHWHGDHTGGNENFAKTGAVIVAHANARTRLARGQLITFLQSTAPPAPPAALPVLSFSDAMSFHLNGQDVHLYHVPLAHTDGDSIVHFASANVIHMGDTWFAGMYPFIDGSSGGTVAGVLAAMDRALSLANEQTRIIPGHGPLGGKAELAATRAMIATVSERISARLARGEAREAIVAAKPTAEFDATHGGGFIGADKWVGMLVDLLTPVPVN
jgi:glyoxylase-like metal-dependent hydrolase (beta-lactamase superfamily II)